MIQKAQAWPQKNLIIISQSPNIYMFLKELVRSVGWSVLKATPSVVEAVNLLQQKQVFLVVIDDSIEEPATSIMRQLMAHMVCFTTPVFAFVLDEHKFETKSLEVMGQVEVVGKPLTPSRFIPAFTKLIRRWETKPYTALRMSFYRYLDAGDSGQYIDWLQKLLRVDALLHLAGPALAKVLLEEGQVQEAEKVLLNILKKDPKNLGSVLSLGDLYLSVALPHIALRLFLSAHKSFEPSSGILPDIVQAEFMLCRIPKVLERLEEMRKNHYMIEKVNPMLARIYISQGRIKEAENLMRDRKGLFLKMHKSWKLIS